MGPQNRWFGDGREPSLLRSVIPKCGDPSPTSGVSTVAARPQIYELERKLRDAVNVREVQDRLMKDERRWEQLCSSMDVIGDTDNAISAYLSSPQIKDVGHLYLLAYGLLQALFVQQDAVMHAAEAIGLSYKFPADVLAVREVRNNAIGHPTKRGSKNPESFGIIQVSLSHDGFTLYSFRWDRPNVFQPIRFKELISAQSEAVAQALEQMILHLQTAQ